METPASVPSATEKPPEENPKVVRQPGHPNLVRYLPGAKPAHLSRPRVTRRTLMEDLKAVLDSKDGLRQRKLAEAIVDNAIDGNAACLSFIAERLAPVERKDGDGGRVVFEGIRLEVVGGSSTTVSMVRGLSEPSSDRQVGGAPSEPVETFGLGGTAHVALEERSESRGEAAAGGPSELPVTSSAFPQESQESPRDVTLET